MPQYRFFNDPKYKLMFVLLFEKSFRTARSFNEEVNNISLGILLLFIMDIKMFSIQKQEKYKELDQQIFFVNH